MTDAQIKKAAAAKLAERGVSVPDDAPFRVIAHAIGMLLGSKVAYNQSLVDYVRAWAVPSKPLKEPYAFKPMAARMHPRHADIDAGQPPMITPNGIGNFKQPGGFMPEVWGVGR